MVVLSDVPGPALALEGSGLLKLKPNPKLRARPGLGLVRLEPRLTSQKVTGWNNPGNGNFHVYHCILGLPFLCQGGYTFHHSNPHILSCETIPRAENPVTTIITIPDYHITEAGWYFTIQANTFNQEMVLGYPNLARPSRCIWEYMEEQKEKEVKFDWFSSSEDDIREEVARILKERESGLG
jgi:hypothetical protein